MPVNDKDTFTKHFTVNITNKCWEWNSPIFRWRIDHVIQSPRRFAAMAAGYVIPAGRNLIAGCGNERCVNPEHTRLKHDGSKLSREAPRYFLDFGHFHFPPGWLARQYCVDKQEVKRMRARTLELIYNIRRVRGIPVKRLANQYNVSDAYVKTILNMTEGEFRAYEDDPNANMYDIDENYNPAGERFKPKHMA